MSPGAAGELVSVIVPAFNAAAHLGQTLDQIRRQSHERIEVIVVDDGSEPPLILRDHPGVRLIRCDSAGGPAAARNLGLQHASGEVIGWCDSDDIFAPDRLAIAQELHRRADLVARTRSLFEAVGPIRRVHPIVPLNRLRGRFVMEGERGSVEVFFTLSPETTPKVQQVRMRRVGG